LLLLADMPYTIYVPHSEGPDFMELIS